MKEDRLLTPEEKVELEKNRPSVLTELQVQEWRDNHPYGDFYNYTKIELAKLAQNDADSYWYEAQLAKLDVCPECGGDGSIWHRGKTTLEAWTRCKTCKGTGKKQDPGLRKILNSYKKWVLNLDGGQGGRCNQDDAIDQIISLFGDVRKQEAQDIIRCIKDAKRVHPDWGIDDIVDLLEFREDTREAIKNQPGDFISLEEVRQAIKKGTK